MRGSIQYEFIQQIIDFFSRRDLIVKITKTKTTTTTTNTSAGSKKKIG
jgi:hypothetical protein